jgi:sugar/nucleoside kinase (ribokinase family)
MSGKRIVVVGDVMTDVIVFPEGPLVRGSDRRAAIRSRPGGSAANQAVWLGSLGTAVSLVARVGSQDREKLDAHFRAFGVDPVLAVDPVLPSGVLVTIVDTDGERSFLTDRGANLALGREDLPLALLDEAKYLVISGYSLFSPAREAVLGYLAEARDRNVSVVVDPASVGFLREAGPDTFLSWTAGAELLLANLDEALTLTGSADLNSQMQILGQRFPRVLIKRGAAGAAIGGANGVELSLAAPKANVRDTTGAGDAFAAGFLAAELNGEPVEACLRAGLAAGTRAVEQVGGQPVG